MLLPETSSVSPPPMLNITRHTGEAMNAILTDSDRYSLTTQVDDDQNAYHLSIDAGPRHIAYADVRPGCSTVSSVSTSPSGIPPRGYVAASSTRCSTSTSCTHTEPCWPHCRSAMSTCSTALPGIAPTFTRGRLDAAASSTGC